MEQIFRFGDPMFVDEVQKKIRWEVVVTDTQVTITMLGAALEPTILTISGKDLDVEDWWGWGAG